MKYRNIAGNPTTLQKLVEDEPEWARSQITRLRAENEALRKDAERYRWIRDNHETDEAAMWIHGNAPPEHWDSEIDIAMHEAVRWND